MVEWGCPNKTDYKEGGLTHTFLHCRCGFSTVPFLSILTGCLISKSVAGGGDMQFASRTSIRWDGEQLYREMQGVDERLRSERRVTESKVAWRPAELRHIPWKTGGIEIPRVGSPP